MTNTMQATEPNWEPLERAMRLLGLPVETCGEFMWMFTEHGGSFHEHEAYKHINTRHYLRLAGDEPTQVCRQALAQARMM